MNERIPVVPHSRQHLVVSLFWIFAILVAMWYYLVVVLSFNSLMMYHFECLFLCSFALFVTFDGMFSDFPPFCPFIKMGCLFPYC
jgi:hypothetical protein